MAALVTVAATGCAGGAGGRRAGARLEARRVAAAPAVADLQASRFDEAERKARGVIARDAGNAPARLVAAVTLYKRAMHQLAADATALVAGLAMTRALNQEYAAFALGKVAAALGEVDAHLAAAAGEPGVSLDLCLACWEVDWNRNGRVDDRDRFLLEVELDAAGEHIPAGDPRRRPTIRFDAGDVHWARAMVAFQRAATELVLAYRVPDAETVAAAVDGRGKIVIRLVDARRVHRARDLVLGGLEQADRARRAYLAETDDEREWVPNPRQKQHPIPLPVDETLYRTWEGVVGDLRRLLAGAEGLDVGELVQLGDHTWDDPPRGFLDLRRLFAQPGDIVIDPANVEALDRRRGAKPAEAVLKDLFGDKYVETMKRSPLPGRLARMREEIERGEEGLDRKLRYLLWLN